MMPTWLAPAALKRLMQVFPYEQAFQGGRQGVSECSDVNIEPPFPCQWAAVGPLRVIVVSINSQQRAN